MIRELEFVTGQGMLFTSFVVAPAVLVLCAIAWHRSRYRPSIGALELLRFVLVCGVLFALNQPETVETQPATEVPVVAVLWDDSGSMATKDVLPTGTVSGAPLTRRERLEEVLDLEALRAALAGRYEVVGGPLSGGTEEPEADAAADPDLDPEGDPASSARAGGTDLAAPMARLLDDDNLRALVLLSDGDWNTGENPADVAMRYRMEGVPILTTTVGSRTALPDVEFLPLEPPAFGLVDKPLAIPYAIRSAMDRDLRVTVTLRDEQGLSASEDVLLPAHGTYEGSLNLTPRHVGTMTVTGSVPIQSGELDETNNESVVSVEVREESLRVLLVESYPRWEYRYMRNAMVRDPGVEVDCLLFHPDIEARGGGPHYIENFPNRAQLSDYDVVFLGDVGVGPEELSAEDCRLIKGLVAEQASGLILMPGFGGRQHTLFGSELGPLYPVELDPANEFGHGSAVAATLRLTEAGRRSTLTKLAADDDDNAELWDTLPGFQWHAPVVQALPGSLVLAVHSDRDEGRGRIPLLVTKTYGTGKILFMGTDGAWRWREGLEDKVHYRFWRQVVRWMAYQRKMNAGESMRLFHSPDRPGVRSLTTLYANVMDDAGSPVLDGTVTARIEAPSGRVTRVEMGADGGEDAEWGLYRGLFRPDEPGEHLVTLTCRETRQRLVAKLNVAGVPLERVGRPARHDVMDELARVSRGESFADVDLSRIEERLLALPEPSPVTRRTRLWSHPLLGATMILLMACFWIGRKLVGRF